MYAAMSLRASAHMRGGSGLLGERGWIHLYGVALRGWPPMRSTSTNRFKCYDAPCPGGPGNALATEHVGAPEFPRKEGGAFLIASLGHDFSNVPEQVMILTIPHEHDMLGNFLSRRSFCPLRISYDRTRRPEMCNC